VSESEKNLEKCPRCDGRGWVIMRGIVENELIPWMDRCPVCKGSGKKPEEKETLK